MKVILFRKSGESIFIAILFIALCSLQFLRCSEEQPTEPEPLSRLDAIPSDALKVTPDQDVHPPRLHSDQWQAPVPVSGSVNTAGAEDSPFILPDGKTLYFFFTPDVSVPPERQLLDGVTGIYVARMQNGLWIQDERVVLQDPGKLALDGCTFVLDDTLWFCSAREGYTGVNLFTAMFRDGKWQNWQYAGDQFCSECEVGELHITPDGNELYFHSSRAGGKGQLDIWLSRRSGSGWGPAENVAAINSSENEGWPCISPDGNELWFTRTHLGSPAIFRSLRVNEQWSEPELILSQFAGEPSLDAAGNIYFVHHFFQDGMMIEADIYVAHRKSGSQARRSGHFSKN